MDRQRMVVFILFIAVILRLLVAVYMGNTVLSLPGIDDQVSYDLLAQRLIAGEGWSFPTAWWPTIQGDTHTSFWSYGYTIYLGIIYKIFGHEPLVSRFIQAMLVGFLYPLLTYRIGRRIFGYKAALAAMALCATYLYFIYYSSALMTEAFYILGILWTIDAAQRIAVTTQRNQSTNRQWVELGIAVGLTVLLRQLFLLFVPFLIGWLLLSLRHHQSVKKSLFGLTLALGLTSACILPFTAYNYSQFNRFVLLNTNAGYAFFWANHPIYGTHFVGVLPADGPSYQELIPQELRHLDEAVLEKELLHRGIGFVLEDPVRYVLLSLSRIPVYFKFWPSAESSLLSNITRVGSFGIALPFMIYGLLLPLARRRGVGSSGDASFPQGVLLLYLFISIYIMIHLLSWTQIRYRLPVDAVLLIFAGLAVADLAERWRVVAGRIGQVMGFDPPDQQPGTAR